MAIKGDNWKGQAASYDEISGREQIKEGLKLLELAGVEQGSRILDLGCGTGRLTAVLAERVGPQGHVVGIDPDAERLTIAKEKNSKPNLTYIEADGETFPGSYDLVYCNLVLHWIKDKEPVFKRVYANLHPGGQFVFVTCIDMCPFFTEMLRTLFQPEKEKEILDNFFHIVPLKILEEIALKSNFAITHKEEGASHRPFDTVEDALKYLNATFGGQVDFSPSNEKAFETFKKKYSNPKAVISTPNVYMILTKPSD